MPRRMPQEAIDRNIERDLRALRRKLNDDEMRHASAALTWFRYHEMSMLADWMVDSILAGRFSRDFYVDDRVSARGMAQSGWLTHPYRRGVGRRDMVKAVLSLKRTLASRR